jgi:hypothetical protein
MDGGCKMEIIRDYKLLKELDKNVTYCCVGFTRPNVFNTTHTHLYEHSINKADKLFGILWDNENDLQVFMNEAVSPYVFDEPSAIKWFEEKDFDYLFIPDSSFITELLNLPKFQEILKEIDGIWKIENYESFLGTGFTPANKKWLKLMLSRNYFFYSDRNNNEKILNRTYQTTAPDGTWGFISSHFWKKYCGGDFPLVPLLRNENGLVFDINMEKRFPQEVINIFISMIPNFKSFSTHRNIEQLKLNLIEDLTKTAPKESSQNYFFYSLDYFCDEIITKNKYILKLQIRGKNPKTYNDAGYDLFRLWEYDPTL